MPRRSSTKHILESAGLQKLIWLSGLLEGEGYFGVVKPTSKRPYTIPRISLRMTDEDVVTEVARLFNRNYYVAKPSDNPLHKQQYVTEISGVWAIDVMELLHPYMFSRRATKIDEVLKTYYADKDSIRPNVG